MSFKAPTRFVADLAVDGKWHEVFDELGNSWGRYLLGLADQTLPKYKAQMARVTRQYQANPNSVNNADAQEAVALRILSEYVYDWDIAAIFDGKNPPGFSRDAFVKLMANADFDWLRRQIDTYTSNVRNFQPEDQSDLPEKN